MYSKASWGGDVDPFILATVPKHEGDDHIISLIFYEYSDYELIGVETRVTDSDGTQYEEVRSPPYLWGLPFNKSLIDGIPMQ
jgi:hypothetical protein